MNGLIISFAGTLVALIIFNLWLNTKSGKKWLHGSE